MANLQSTESAYINWLRRRIPAHPRVLIGPGDDTAAVIVDGTRPLLITTDMLMEGSCFLLKEAGPRAVGRKALAVNLSDIAAMAGTPTAAVVSLGLPRTGGRELAEQLFEGIHELADEFRVPIVGGDTNTWSGQLVISITVIGESIGHRPVPRSGARAGDWIFVTGHLGGSILGKHLSFTPRLREATALHQQVTLRAMIDISDGLAKELHHLGQESGCGARLRSAAIPIADAARQLALTSGKPPLRHALGDGEDFELLFCVSPEDGERLLQNPVVPVFHIGEMTDAGFEIEIDGNHEPLEAWGYEHAMSE